MTKYLSVFLILITSATFADDLFMKGEFIIDDWTEQVELHNYRISGRYYDYSPAGWTAGNIAVSNLIFIEISDGSADPWQITNVVSAGVISLTVDVAYAESGSSTVGMVAGYAGLCSLSANSVGFPQRPSPEFCHLSPNLLNQINNYSFRRIPVGGTGGITNWPTPAEIGAAGTDEVFTVSTNLTEHIADINNPHAVTAGQIGAVATNDISVTNARPPTAHSQDYTTITDAPWLTYSATQEVTWTKSVVMSNDFLLTNLIVSGTLNPNAIGTYGYAGNNSWGRTWTNSNINGTFTIDSDVFTNWFLWESVAGIWSQTGTGPEGTNYLSDNTGVTGTATVAYSYVPGYSITTNISTWQAGVNSTNPAVWGIASGGTNLVEIFSLSNVFTKPIYGDGSGLTNLIVPEINDLVTATGSLNAAVGNLIYSTNSLQVKIDVLNTSTDVLNTAVGNLQTTTNALNTRAGNLESVTGVLNTVTVTISTQLFAGAGTTGRITSAAAGTNGFLKGDGTWTTPAGAGDFKADGSVAMTGPFNGGGQNATNIGLGSMASLQVTGGSPVAGGSLYSTNTLGQMGYSSISSYAFFYTTGTRSNDNIVISGIGFRPSSAIIFATASSSEMMSWGVIDSSGAGKIVGQTADGTGTGTGAGYGAYLYTVGGKYWTISWSSWNDGGATLTQTYTSNMVTNNINVTILLQR